MNEILKLQKELEITETELEILRGKYQKLSDGVDRAATVIANCATEIALKTYLDDLEWHGVTMKLEYKHNPITYSEMIGIMLSSCIEAREMVETAKQEGI